MIDAPLAAADLAGPHNWWGLGAPRFALWKVTHSQIRALGATVMRIRGTGQERLPATGPYLLLPNHTSFLDPFTVTAPLRRPLHYMASAESLKTPVMGPYLKALGAFPKVKYLKDSDSMRQMTELYNAGHVVTIFPEGRRSWDGVTLPLLPGLGRTVKRLKARVVLARMTTTYFFHPRWAVWPRYAPNWIEYLGPFEYTEEQTAEEITADIERRLRVESHLPDGVPVRGWRLAEGLPNLLWACPRCLNLGGLDIYGEDRDHLRCRACGEAWRLDVATRLHPVGGGEPLIAGAAWRDLCARLGEQPVQDARRHAASGVVLATARGIVSRVRRGHGVDEVARGQVLLSEDRLTVRGAGGELWALKLQDMVSVSVELGNRVQLRTEDALFQLDVVGESVLKWGHFIKRWRDPADPIEAG